MSFTASRSYSSAFRKITWLILFHINSPEVSESRRFWLSRSRRRGTESKWITSKGMITNKQGFFYIGWFVRLWNLTCETLLNKNITDNFVLNRSDCRCFIKIDFHYIKVNKERFTNIVYIALLGASLAYKGR